MKFKRRTKNKQMLMTSLALSTSHNLSKLCRMSKRKQKQQHNLMTK